MAKHLTMNTVIHAAVRRDLRRFTAALATFPVGSKERATALSRAWQHLDGQLYHHHHSEETIFWPALREVGADESLVDRPRRRARPDGRGDEGHQRGRWPSWWPIRARSRSSRPGRPSSRWRQAVETHFAHEETDLEAFSASVSDTAPMKRAQDQVRKTQSPTQAGGYLAWLQDEADADALAYLGTAIPRPVLVDLQPAARPALPAGDRAVWAT